MLGNAVSSSGNDRLSFILIVEEPGYPTRDLRRLLDVDQDSGVAFVQQPRDCARADSSYDRQTSAHGLDEPMPKLSSRLG